MSFGRDPQALWGGSRGEIWVSSLQVSGVMKGMEDVGMIGGIERRGRDGEGSRGMSGRIGS